MTAPMQSRSKRWTVEASYDAIYELACDQFWSDGLPIVPPTVDRVTRMIEATGRGSDEVVALIPPRNGQATIEKIAINAVMAGCKPEYMPVVIAAVEALSQPSVNLSGIQTTTNPVAPLAIVHGPVAERIGMNSGCNVLGPGNRANATIGRAIRLILINIGGGIAGLGDKSTHGQPAKYTFCMAENARETPWQPMHADKGLDPSASALTIFPVICSMDLATGGVIEPDALLFHVANSMVRSGSELLRAPGPVLVLLPPDYARVSFAQRGWTKNAIRQRLFEMARIDPGTLPEDVHEARHKHGDPSYVDGKICAVEAPADIDIVVVGAPEPHHIQILEGASHWGVVTRQLSD